MLHLYLCDNRLRFFGYKFNLVTLFSLNEVLTLTKDWKLSGVDEILTVKFSKPESKMGNFKFIAILP